MEYLVVLVQLPTCCYDSLLLTVLTWLVILSQCCAYLALIAAQVWRRREAYHDTTALESPTLAVYTTSSTTMIAQAHDPDRSLMIVWFYSMNYSSASLNPSLRACSGFAGKQSWRATKWCRLSLRYSAHPDPPCPSKTAKKDTFLYWAYLLAPGFFKSSTIETLSSL